MCGGTKLDSSTDRVGILTPNMRKQARCPTFQAASDEPMGERDPGSDDRRGGFEVVQHMKSPRPNQKEWVWPSVWLPR